MTTDPNLAVVLAGPSRRTTLKRGLAVGGAAVWAVPAVQALSTTAASAVLTSPGPGGEEPPPPPPPTGKYISHGFVLVLCDGNYYAAKIEGSTAAVTDSGKQDLSFLERLGYPDISRGLPPGFVGSYGTLGNELSLVLVVPDTCEIVGLVAVSFDGSFQNKQDPTSDKFGFATIVGNTVYFRASDDDD